eukprot:CCRYP_010277-RA/>CCRYP_010277-RA protein AED:0.46 eAED:0.36 QI:0/0/0/1/0/0/3/0/688
MDFNLPVEDVQEVQLFIGSTIGEQNPGTIYTDQTGNFPVWSFHGKKCQFLAYDYRSNAILVRAQKDQTDKSLLEPFQEVYEYLTKRGFQTKLNVMDNQCSKTIQKFIEKNGAKMAKIQLVNTDDHRVNAAERAIQTWKNHWLSGLGTLDPNCPLQLWCQFIEQRHDNLNMLITSRINNKISVYAILEGQYESDKTPLAPVGTKALVLLDPKKRTSWNTHAVDAWYVGPAKKHYRNLKFYIPETRGYRIANTAKYFPRHCKQPAIEPGDSIRLAVQDLISALKQKNKLAPISLHHKHTEALRKLSEIFSQAAAEVRPVPRVPTETAPSMSVTPAIHPQSEQFQYFTRESQEGSNQCQNLSQQSMRRASRAWSAQGGVSKERITAKLTQENNKAISTGRSARSNASKTMPNFRSQHDDHAGHVERMNRHCTLQASTNARGITSQAVYHLMGQRIKNATNHFIPAILEKDKNIFQDNILLDHMANSVVHPITQETITKYEKLANDPTIHDVWMKGMCKELERLAQGYKDTKGPTLFSSGPKMKSNASQKTEQSRILSSAKEDPNRWAEISLTSLGSSQPEQQISQQQKFCGTAHSAHQEQNLRQQTWEIFFWQLHSTDMNTCESRQIWSLKNSNKCTNSMTKYTMDSFIWRSAEDATDFPKVEFWRTSYSRNDWQNMGSLNYPTHQAYGNM